MQKSLVSAVAVLFALLAFSLSFGEDKVLCTDSVLCMGAAEHFNFEEGSDYARESAVGNVALFEPDGYDVPRAAGKLGSYAVDFAGTSTSYLTTRDGAHFGNGFYSISFWIYPDTLGSAGQKQYVISNDRTSSPGESFYLENVSSTLRPTWQVKQMDATTITLQASSGISTGAWHFVVVEVYPSFNETATTSNAKVYMSVDGAARTSASLTAPIRAGFGPLRLGGRPQSGGENPFDGRLDHVTFYGGTLIDDEISLAYNSGSGRVYPFSTP